VQVPGQVLAGGLPLPLGLGPSLAHHLATGSAVAGGEVLGAGDDTQVVLVALLRGLDAPIQGRHLVQGPLRGGLEADDRRLRLRQEPGELPRATREGLHLPRHLVRRVTGP
jgi:hypothetical protein